MSEHYFIGVSSCYAVVAGVRKTKKLLGLLTSNKPNITLYVVIRSARRRRSSRLSKSSGDNLSEYDSDSKPGIRFVNRL